ncbi:late histone H2B.L4-like [Carcharodon carcharias]|uniref:late histone H2B.L4-like n=1 Tax=Carcharodon carcharias TaxID=13397 RepID=UPI001B7EBE07|nr:late histone H2B.L4-like [Carcharodon carcharias]
MQGFLTGESSHTFSGYQVSILEGQCVLQGIEAVTKKLPKKRRKSRKQSYSTHVYRVLTQVHPSTGISSKAISVMNSFDVGVFKHITSEILHFIHYNELHTILARDIQSAIRLMLPGELAKHTVSEGTKVVTKYTNST